MNCLHSPTPKKSRPSVAILALYLPHIGLCVPKTRLIRIDGSLPVERRGGGGGGGGVRHLMKFLCSSSRRQCSLAPSRLFILIRRHRPRSLSIIYHNLSSNNLSHNIWPLEDRETRESVQIATLWSKVFFFVLRVVIDQTSIRFPFSNVRSIAILPLNAYILLRYWFFLFLWSNIMISPLLNSSLSNYQILKTANRYAVM